MVFNTCLNLVRTWDALDALSRLSSVTTVTFVFLSCCGPASRRMKPALSSGLRRGIRPAADRLLRRAFSDAIRAGLSTFRPTRSYPRVPTFRSRDDHQLAMVLAGMDCIVGSAARRVLATSEHAVSLLVVHIRSGDDPMYLSHEEIAMIPSATSIQVKLTSGCCAHNAVGADGRLLSCGDHDDDSTQTRRWRVDVFRVRDLTFKARGPAISSPGRRPAGLKAHATSTGRRWTIIESWPFRRSWNVLRGVSDCCHAIGFGQLPTDLVGCEARGCRTVGAAAHHAQAGARVSCSARLTDRRNSPFDCGPDRGLSFRLGAHRPEDKITGSRSDGARGSAPTIHALSSPHVRGLRPSGA